VASLELPPAAQGLAADTAAAKLPGSASYRKFTDQDALGHFLLQSYKIKNPRQLSSCDTCHR
jgi:hypothetical protein